MPRLCGFYPGICLTTEQKAWKNLSQGSHTQTYNVVIIGSNESFKTLYVKPVDIPNPKPEKVGINLI
jgi:hypothetical protein